jgi:hypothetical protein
MMIGARRLAVDLAGAHGRALAQGALQQAAGGDDLGVEVAEHLDGTVRAGAAGHGGHRRRGGLGARAGAAAEELRDALSRAVGAPATVTVPIPPS